MQMRLDAWKKKEIGGKEGGGGGGGKKDKEKERQEKERREKEREGLWESVKNAEKREGVVVRADSEDLGGDEMVKMEVDNPPTKIEGDREGESECPKPTILPAPASAPTPTTNGNSTTKPPPAPAPAKKTKIEREVERLNVLLEQVVKLREEVKKGMEVVLWREKLLELATERAELVGRCGWDQRLCFGDEECAEFGAGVLESYANLPAPEEKKEKEAESEGEEEVEEEDGMQVDAEEEEEEEETTREEEEWWCPGKSLCDRHNG